MVQSRLPSRYRVIEEVGQGGMAVVYRAEDETLRREVAIKVLHPHLLAEPESKARLQREAQAVAKLHHDNILQVFDYSGSSALASYIVTEFIEGQTLKQFFATRKTPMPEVAALISIEVGNALAHAHGLGIIHRDVKPDNVMMRSDGVLKLMDFGVAQILDLERMTVTGQLLGSPAYMAPELFEGKPLDVRTDVFSLGVMLYQMATGALPFSGRNPHEVLKRIAEGRFTDPRTLNRLVADRLTRVIARALAKKPDDRYSTVAAMVADLEAYVADAGLEEPREEVRRFVIDPDGYEKALPARVVAGLIAMGHKERVAGRLARALECWNRALSLDPKNEEILRALRRIEGRRRVYRSGVVLGGAAVLGGLIWGAFKLAREDVPAPIAKAIGGKPDRNKIAPPPVKVAMPKVETAREKAERMRTVQGRAPAAMPVARREPTRTAAAAQPRTRVFTIAPSPKRVEVFLDKVKKLDFDVGKEKIEVPWDGTHEIMISNDACCNPFVIEIGPDKPSKFVENDRILAVLERKLATVTVTLSPPHDDAQIEIREIGDSPNAMKPMAVKTGEPVSIHFDATGEARRRLQVSVYAGDRNVKKSDFVIAPGEKKDVRISLD